MRIRGAAGAVVVATLLISGCGMGLRGAQSGTGPGVGASSTVGGRASIAIPSDALVFSNVQTEAGNWRSFGQAPPDYADCSAPCGEASWEEIYGIADPSKSADATMFDLNPEMPYADALFTAGLIGQNSPQRPDWKHRLLPTLHHFVYDAYFYVPKPDITQSLEFDISDWMDGVGGMTFGHQCDHLGDGQWDIWDNQRHEWVGTGFACQFVQGWNHVTLQMERGPKNTLVYQTITLNGTAKTLNRSYATIAAPRGWWGLAANYQMDSDERGASNTTYVDDLTVAAWPGHEGQGRS